MRLVMMLAVGVVSSLLTDSAVAAQIGYFRGGSWMLDTNGDNQETIADSPIFFGSPGEQPIVLKGACSGNPEADIGTVRAPSTWLVTTDNMKWDATDSANTFTFGTNGKAMTWNSCAVSWESGFFYIDWNCNGFWDGAGPGQPDFVTSFTAAADLPVLGRWAAGTSKRLGTFSNGVWHVDFNQNNRWDGSVVDRDWTFGSPGEIPVPADYNPAVPGDELATFSAGTWFVDFNGNHVWNGTGGGDKLYTFGRAGDVPVVTDSRWTGFSGCSGGG